MAIILIQFAAVAVTALGQPLNVWDSWVNWGLKARLIFEQNGLTPALWADPTRLITLPDYPLFVPLLQAWTYTVLGAFDDRWAALPLLLFHVALLVGLHGSLRRQGVAPTWALAATAAVACLPTLTNLVSSVFSDAVIAALATLAAAYLLEWAQRGDAGALLAAALAAGLLPWTKREGLILAAALLGAALLLLWRLRRPGWLRLFALSLAPVAVLAGPWYAFTALAGVPNLAYAPVSLAGYAQNAGRLLYVVWRGLRTALEPRLLFVWPLAGVLFVATALTERTRRFRLGAAEWLCFGVPAAYLLVLAQGYVFSNLAPFEQHVVNSLERLVLHVSLLPVLWLALQTRRMPKSSPRPA